MKNRRKEVIESSAISADQSISSGSKTSLFGKMTRRDFGRLFGTQVMLASTASLSGC